jgi:hypothetical protein
MMTSKLMSGYLLLSTDIIFCEVLNTSQLVLINSCICLIASSSICPLDLMNKSSSIVYYFISLFNAIILFYFESIFQGCQTFGTDTDKFLAPICRGNSGNYSVWLFKSITISLQKAL